jgi:hypothetical protein
LPPTPSGEVPSSSPSGSKERPSPGAPNAASVIVYTIATGHNTKTATTNIAHTLFILSTSFSLVRMGNPYIINYSLDIIFFDGYLNKIVKNVTEKKRFLKII